ncbi:terpene synthase 18, sesterterpene synthase 1 [Hibiscus trionum]|uniref:Terpene synthase 18, sesterterpene synthase 1 n=1 Tax=Hibiscus trionum TaxID=183268 RepID=A0A9W7M504_HIBTR|nr:terpene synthase 18, sesterterpene synthase 1 [Hibiscus trionum]
MAIQGSVLANTTLCPSKGLSWPTPILPIRLHNIGGNTKGCCFAVLSTNLVKAGSSSSSSLQASSNHREIARPLANFAPDIWGDRFLTLPFDSSEFESCSNQVEVLKAMVKDMLVASAIDPIENIKLINSLYRLGVSYNFKTEIQKQLAHHFISLGEIIDHNKDHDLHTIGVIFQVFRSYRYNMSSDVFNKFKDENDKFKMKPWLSQNRCWSPSSQSTDPHLTEYIVNALNRPYHRGVPRLEARQYICFYEKEASKNETLLKFAKYDFNRLQMMHQQELRVLCSWWKEGGMESRFPHVRHRIVESYYTLMHMFGFLDDAYATFEELQCFTSAMKRYDIAAMDKLQSDYLKLVYEVILAAHDEVEEKLRNEGRSFAVSYARKEFTRLVEAYHEQARWVHEGYEPTFDDFLETALKSSGGTVTMAQVLVGMEEADGDVYRCLINTDNMIIKALNSLSRLYDDINTNEEEVKTWACLWNYLLHEATEAYRERIEVAWKDLREGCLKPPTSVRQQIVTAALNLLDTAYKTEDGYGIPAITLKHVITKILIHPIPL